MQTAEPTKTEASTITGLDLAAYLVKDPARSIAFYRDVLGLVPTAIDDEGRGAEFTLSDGSTFGVWRPDQAEHAPGGCVMFAVGDAKAAVQRLRERGATVTDPEETPVCFMAFGQDPDGNGFCIHQRKNAD
jgi:lactoylglutathione lyase